ncbi:MAG: hypothetical protein NTZ35_11960 [Ignavibacteriales bacterium]|nr:hypothetical protein [Ignavibacteriales bacterium]
MKPLTAHSEISGESRRALIHLKKHYLSVYYEFAIRKKDMPYPLAANLKREFDEIVEKIHRAEQALGEGREEEARLRITQGESNLLSVDEKIAASLLRKNLKPVIEYTTHEDTRNDGTEEPI